ncbi:MAG: hypothetical protein SVY10_20000, partial [Thermodesulfobacteriota bacterium]|nr:hypothetical protein [Thermodesulfobacteriota bacterium]
MPVSEDLKIPTLSELEPVANYVAMRFALVGVSKTKVMQILELFHSHVFKVTYRANEKPTLNLDITLLTNWLTQAKGINNGELGTKVLQKVLLWYNNECSRRTSDKEKRHIYESLSNFLTIVSWKFKCFEDIKGFLVDLCSWEESESEVFQVGTQPLKFNAANVDNFMAYLAPCQSINKRIEELVSCDLVNTAHGLCDGLEVLRIGETEKVPWFVHLFTGIRPSDNKIIVDLDPRHLSELCHSWKPSKDVRVVIPLGNSLPVEISLEKPETGVTQVKQSLKAALCDKMVAPP